MGVTTTAKSKRASFLSSSSCGGGGRGRGSHAHSNNPITHTNPSLDDHSVQSTGSRSHSTTGSSKPKGETCHIPHPTSHPHPHPTPHLNTPKGFDSFVARRRSVSTSPSRASFGGTFGIGDTKRASPVLMLGAATVGATPHHKRELKQSHARRVHRQQQQRSHSADPLSRSTGRAPAPSPESPRFMTKTSSNATKRASYRPLPLRGAMDAGTGTGSSSSSSGRTTRMAARARGGGGDGGGGVGCDGIGSNAFHMYATDANGFQSYIGQGATLLSLSEGDDATDLRHDGHHDRGMRGGGLGGFPFATADADASADAGANVVEFAAWGGESKDPLDGGSALEKGRTSFGDMSRVSDLSTSPGTLPKGASAGAAVHGSGSGAYAYAHTQAHASDVPFGQVPSRHGVDHGGDHGNSHLVTSGMEPATRSSEDDKLNRYLAWLSAQTGAGADSDTGADTGGGAPPTAYGGGAVGAFSPDGLRTVSSDIAYGLDISSPSDEVQRRVNESLQHSGFKEGPVTHPCHQASRDPVIDSPDGSSPNITTNNDSGGGRGGASSLFNNPLSRLMGRPGKASSREPDLSGR